MKGVYRRLYYERAMKQNSVTEYLQKFSSDIIHSLAFIYLFPHSDEVYECVRLQFRILSTINILPNDRYTSDKMLFDILYKDNIQELDKILSTVSHENNNHIERYNNQEFRRLCSQYFKWVAQKLHRRGHLNDINSLANKITELFLTIHDLDEEEL